MNLTIFNQSDFLTALRAFFAELQVPIASVTDAPIAAQDILENNYKDNESFRLIDEVYFLGMVDDAAFRGGKSLDISQIKSDYDGILIFGVTLKVREGGVMVVYCQRDRSLPKYPVRLIGSFAIRLWWWCLGMRGLVGNI